MFPGSCFCLYEHLPLAPFELAAQGVKETVAAEADELDAVL